MDERALAAALAHADENQESFLAGFQELLRFPSISTDPAHRDDLEACGDWILGEMERIGFQQCRKMRTDGHPVLYGEWLQAGPDAPTAIIYAHYDVQPIDPLALWDSPPFEPTRRDERLYARGVVDNKCGVWGNLKTFESLIAGYRRIAPQRQALLRRRRRERFTKYGALRRSQQGCARRRLAGQLR